MQACGPGPMPATSTTFTPRSGPVPWPSSYVMRPIMTPPLSSSGRSSSERGQVGTEVLGVFEPDREPQHVVVRLGLVRHGPVGQRGRVLHEGVDPAEARRRA